MFRKGEIFRMKEAEFQNSVLIPLFRAMGFHDVTAFGGGNLERGKDIVMWKESDLGQRLNYGVVVKAKKITGNAETNHGAMNVLNQVRQMLKSTYLNPVNGKSETIQRCFVACSKEITKEAMNSIEGELDNNLDKVVEWIHPETNLFDLITRFFPEQSIFEKLSSVKTTLETPFQNTPYRIVADTDNKFTLLGKHEKALEEMPFEIPMKFIFDTKDPKARKKQKEFEDFLKTGKAIEIDGKYIDSFDLPEFLPSFIKNINFKQGKISLSPNKGTIKLPIAIEILNRKTSAIQKLDYVDLENIQGGQEQIVFDNSAQNVPWQVKVIIDFKKNCLNLNLDFKLGKSNFNLFQELSNRAE